MFTIEVENIDGKTDVLYVYGEQTILCDLEANNIFLNHNCRQGHCGDCILQLLGGQVSHQKSLVPLSRGEILACCAKPVSDIKIGLKSA